MGLVRCSGMWVMYCGYLLNYHFNFKWRLIRSIYNNQIMTESEIAGYFCYWPTEGQKEPIKVPFFVGDNSIGRNKDNKIIIPNQGTSKYHGKLIVSAMAMKYIDLGGRNGTKINNDSEDNILSPKTQVDVFDGTTLYLGQIKCKIQRLPFKENEETLPTGQRPKKNIATQQIFKMVFSDDNEEEIIQLNPKNNAKTKQEEVKSKQTNAANIEIDQFSISDDFNGMNRREKSKNTKKQKDNKETKKTGKSVKQEKVQTKEQHRKPEQNQQNKKKQKKESLEKLNPQKSLDKDNKDQKQDKVDKAPNKDNKNVRKQKFKQIKQEKNEPADKNRRKSKEKQEIKKKQAEKEEQLKKQELLKKQEAKKKEKQQQKLKENKKNAEKSISKQKDKRKSKQKQTDTQVEQVEVLNVSRRNLRSTNANEKGQQGHDTKRRVSQHRKRLPSEMVSADAQFYPLRKSFMNKRILISGFVPNLTKKYFCIVDKIQDEFDYLVMKEYKRTFKALYAICRGINILRYEWIKDSEFLEKTLKPDGYIFKEFEFIYHSIEKANEGFRVFRSLQFYLGSDQYHLKIQDIQALIYAGGGEMMKKIGKLSPKEKESKNKIAIIRNLDEKNQKIHDEELKRIKKLGFDEIYSIEMVLDSCQKQEIDWSKNKFNPK